MARLSNRVLLATAAAAIATAPLLVPTPAAAHEYGGYGGYRGGYGGYRGGYGGYGGYRGGYGGGYGYRGGYGGYGPGAIVGGALLGLGVGALLAAPYVAPPPVVYAPPPVYYAPQPYYAPPPYYAAPTYPYYR